MWMVHLTKPGLTLDELERKIQERAPSAPADTSRWQDVDPPVLISDRLALDFAAEMNRKVYVPTKEQEDAGHADAVLSSTFETPEDILRLRRYIGRRLADFVLMIAAQNRLMNRENYTIFARSSALDNRLFELLKDDLFELYRNRESMAMTNLVRRLGDEFHRQAPDLAQGPFQGVLEIDGPYVRILKAKS